MESNLFREMLIACVGCVFHKGPSQNSRIQHRFYDDLSEVSVGPLQSLCEYFVNPRWVFRESSANPCGSSANPL